MCFWVVFADCLSVDLHDYTSSVLIVHLCLYFGILIIYRFIWLSFNSNNSPFWSKELNQSDTFSKQLFNGFAFMNTDWDNVMWGCSWPSHYLNQCWHPNHAHFREGLTCQLCLKMVILQYRVRAKMHRVIIATKRVTSPEYVTNRIRALAAWHRKHFLVEFVYPIVYLMLLRVLEYQHSDCGISSESNISEILEILVLMNPLLIYSPRSQIF